MLQTSLNVAAGFMFVWIYNEFDRLMHYSSATSRLRKQLSEAVKLKESEMGNIKSMLKQKEGGEQRETDRHETSCSIALSVDSLPPSTYIFSKTFQAVPIGKSSREEDGFFSGVAGGEFQVGNKDLKVKVDLRECNIDESLLWKSSQKLKVLENGPPTYQRVTIHMRPSCSFVLVGTLSYSLTTGAYTFCPSFLLNPLVRSDILEKAHEYVNSKVLAIRGKQFLLISLAALILMLRKDSFKRLASSAFSWAKSFWVQPEGIAELREVLTRPEDRLKCACGKPLDMIYECGHLSICERCHRSARRKLCPICRRESTKFEKVYT